MNNTNVPTITRRSLLLRIALVPVIATVLSAFNLMRIAMRGAPHGPPPLLRIFWVESVPALSWVALSIPVQLATRRLSRQRAGHAVLAHVVVAAAFVASHSVLVTGMRAAAGLSNPRLPMWGEAWHHAVTTMPQSLLVYAAVVAGTLAWDNLQLSLRRERTAAQLTAELTRTELALLRSKMQPHFLFNALNGISSVMNSDVQRARRMMASLSQLLRSSMAAADEYVPLDHELQFTRDYLELQHLRFETRLRYHMQVDARTHLLVPSFILQPLVENAVVHGMADRAQAISVHVAVREFAGGVEIDVSDDGPGFPQAMLDGTGSPGVGLGALRARLLAMQQGAGSMTLRNRPGGGAQVIVRVPTREEGRSDA